VLLAEYAGHEVYSEGRVDGGSVETKVGLSDGAGEGIALEGCLDG